MARSKNSYPTVVSKPTPYKGGMNEAPKVVSNPTRYKGGMNSSECNVPKKK